VAVCAIEDLVSRKWLAEIVSVEETSTQVQVVFCEALEREGLLGLVGARQDGLVDLTVDDPSRPVLLGRVSRIGGEFGLGAGGAVEAGP
jgi:hypothetical protein